MRKCWYSNNCLHFLKCAVPLKNRVMEIMTFSSLWKNKWSVNKLLQWGSVIHQMAVPVPSISRCVLNHHNLFYPKHNALAFNWDTCCHLALCLQLLPSHLIVKYGHTWDMQNFRYLMNTLNAFVLGLVQWMSSRENKMLYVTIFFRF